MRSPGELPLTYEGHMFPRKVRFAFAAALVAILTGAVCPALAGAATSKGSPTDHAWKAIQKGDYRTDLAEPDPLPARGDPNAQFLLGRLYDAGHGVEHPEQELGVRDALRRGPRRSAGPGPRCLA